MSSLREYLILAILAAAVIAVSACCYVGAIELLNRAAAALN